MSRWRPARGERSVLFAPVEICPLLRVDRSGPPVAPKLITIRGSLLSGIYRNRLESSQFGFRRYWLKASPRLALSRF